MYRTAPVRSPRRPRALGRALLASLAMAGALVGCGTSLPLATSGDAARAGVQLADLQEGRSLVAAKCGNCHPPPVPAAHHTGDWPRMLDEMSARSPLDLAQRHMIEQYLMTMAAR